MSSQAKKDTYGPTLAGIFGGIFALIIVGFLIWAMIDARKWPFEDLHDRIHNDEDIYELYKKMPTKNQ
ncbi:hypothetical protein BBBOND_0211730 [Babesia bigemina]|uniref:Uncharacterized protein n=1 Tax=Babesia bigemina TaxID=5866 RepID=A0A061D5M7_BABBI|nr:hypothetical protein BBBOND_0211730 [Babesia bigemina]CDR96031.1 hypothetical protein BBBOND_0211730 [Babesia bigemina]|eukprot:XP_012768217.1 hypothetical protein BBBOND_0211730 [Babesia bigemina]